MDEFKLDKDGNVVETSADVLEAYKKILRNRKNVVYGAKPTIDHYSYCRYCFHHNACSGMDTEDHMYDLDSCPNHMPVMTPEEFAERMKELSEECNYGDNEVAHKEMDELMCELLTVLGYGEGVAIFGDAHKWYA